MLEDGGGFRLVDVAESWDGLNDKDTVLVLLVLDAIEPTVSDADADATKTQHPANGLQA
jgi:hypothetical protein